MCFSPGVDLMTGVAITAIGVDTLRHVERPSEKALALLPVVFGVHQIVEAAVWWGVDGRVAEGVAQWSAWIYLAVAFGLLPWFVPWAVRRTEADAARRKMMAILTILGGAVSIILMLAVIQGPVVVSDGGHYLAYDIPLNNGGVLVMAYVVATCGGLLVSSDRRIVQFGAINLLAVTVLAMMLSSGLISLWCVWAAVTSVMIAIHLRRTDQYTQRVRSADATS